MKRNIYLVQINYLHGKSTFLPYAAGTLIAAAKQHSEINDFFSFEDPIFIRENTDKVLDGIKNPYLVGFSNYIWNHEYNKVLAKKIKEKFPDCLILFGGHHITPDESLMQKEAYIDIMCFGEGEETFASLLLALKNGNDLSLVPNIAFRHNGTIRRNQTKKCEKTDYPSPYLTGVFDSILEKHPDIDFHSVIETNRGCPYKCAYCDSGDLQCNVRFFPEEKVMKELNWLSDHGISGFGCADANFGMFERDEKFVKEIVRLHKEKGVLSRFQISSAKNSNNRVFRIAKMLNECGMDKGATLSFQSLNPDVLNNINRTNIPVSTFIELLNKYSKAGISTYSELIIGLPGETLTSFIDGIDTLLNSGQHSSIYIHNCEWLPHSTLGKKEYMKKHEIEFALIPLNEPHIVVEDSDDITEYSRLIVKTKTMSHEDWIKMNIYAATVQCFHHEGLLMLFALFLHYENGLKYSDFYNQLIEHFFSSPNSLAGMLYNKLNNRFADVAEGKESIVWEDMRFGNVRWPPEEFLFLNIAIEANQFFCEIKDFLKSFFDDKELFENLYIYQKNVVKLPFKSKIDFKCKYDFKTYFSNLLKGEYSALTKRNCHNVIDVPIKCKDWQDYARHIVWYGRKGSRNIYLREITIQSY